jgi:hypothetical protein
MVTRNFQLGRETHKFIDSTCKYGNIRRDIVKYLDVHVTGDKLYVLKNSLTFGVKPMGSEEFLNRVYLYLNYEIYFI